MTVAAAYVEDVLLVDRCLTGEPAATRELFRRHRGRVHACLFRVLGSNRDMDDLLQEAFLQVFQSLRGWRAEASLATWIDRVAVRVAYRYLSQRGRRDPDRSDRRRGRDRARRRRPGARRQLARDGVKRLYAVLDELVAGGAPRVHAARDRRPPARRDRRARRLVGDRDQAARVARAQADRGSGRDRSGAQRVPRARRATSSRSTKEVA